MPRKRDRLSLDQRAALPVADDNLGLEYLRLSRQEICQTEINAAVRLFLIDEDLISAFLLASAASEIMVALSKGKSGVGLNDLHALIKAADVSSSLSEEVFHELLHPFNFLKHSSSDFSIENDFPINYMIITIYSAVVSYHLLFDDLSTEMKVFSGVLQVWRIHWWEGTPDFEERLRIAKKLSLSNASRKEICKFGRNMLQVAWNQVSS